MSIPLRVLIVEDSEDDALLIQRELRRGGFSVYLKRVETSRAMRIALEEESWDIVISDYNLPGFNGLAALQVLKQVGLDLPFFLVSGAVGDDIAVSAMQSGAQDYVKKDNLARLIPAIQRELREAQVRFERTQVQEQLEDSEERYETLVENIPVGVFRASLSENGPILMANPSFMSMFGFDSIDHVRRSAPQQIFASSEEYDLFCRMLHHEPSLNGVEMRLRKITTNDEQIASHETNTGSYNSEIWGLVTARLSVDPTTGQEFIDCVIEDITQRKRSEQLKDALYQITQASNTTQSLDDLLKAFHRIISGLMPAENFYLALHDPTTQIISYPYFVDKYDPPPSPETLGKSLTGYVIRTGEPLLASPELYLSLLESGLVEEIGAPSLDWLGVPLRGSSGLTFGALVVQTYDSGIRYTENERSILSFVSSHIAIAIERKRAEDALRISESKQRALLEAIPDIILLVDSEGTILDCKFSPAVSMHGALADYAHQISGLAENLQTPFCVGSSVVDHFDDISKSDLENGIQHVLQTSDPAIADLSKTSDLNGETRYYEARMTLTVTDRLDRLETSDGSANILGNLPQVLILVRDVTEEHLAEHRAEAQRAFLRQVIDINPNFIFAKDSAGRYTLANRAVADAYGTTVEDLIGKTDADINPLQEEVSSFKQDDLEVITSLREKIIHEERVTGINGRTRWMQTVKRPLILPDQNEVQVLGVSTDITDRKRAVEQMLHNAFHDSLTGLPNRALLLDRLDRVIERSRRHDNIFYALMLMDLDRFAMINDSLGHRIGDHILIATAERLVGMVRPVDTIARIGGDEFVVLLEDLENLTMATQMAERILSDLQQPLMVQNQKVVVSSSMGIVLGGSTYERPEDIMRDADIALNRAKMTGKGKYAIFANVMRASVVAHLELDNDLRHALENNELEVHFEPIIALHEPDMGKALNFEALVRWRHPIRGIVPPSQFIPFAEETGLIVPLGEWVLSETCRVLRQMEEKYPWTNRTSVSVNISSRQFSQPNLVPSVRRILDQTHFNANRLRLEITETVLMENADLSIAALNQLRDMGVQIYVDDFGTGYSSLYYLHRLPLNVIKIDRTFISGGEYQGGRLEIVDTIVRLANGLKMETIAEGVETVTQLRRMQQLGLDYVQGFLFFRTMAPKDFEEFLANHSTNVNWVSQRLND
jgi:diguanylate cyclase (GGDEF)-like protein/PAS domain S-box-containing protein